MWRGLEMSLTVGLPLAVLVAVVAAGAAGLRALRRPGRRATAARPVRAPGRRGTLARRVCVVLLCAVTLTVTATQESYVVATTPGTGQELAAEPAHAGPVSAAVRRIQVGDWGHYGGLALLRRFDADLGRISTALRRAAAAGTGQLDPAAFRPSCADLERVAKRADAYFAVPDTQGQALWRSFVSRSGTTGRDCVAALADQDGPGFIRSMGELAATGRTVRALALRLRTLGAG
jgi:hypothetical protein